MDTNDTITLREQREMEHEEDLEMIRYYLPVEKKWNTIYKIFFAIVFGSTLGNLFTLLAINKKKRIKKIAKEVLSMIAEEYGEDIEIKEVDLECLIKRAMNKIG